MTNKHNPLNITQDDFGKEGRFTYQGFPAVLVRWLNGHSHPTVLLTYTFDTGQEAAAMLLADFKGLKRLPRKLYIAVSRKPTGQIHGTTCAYQSREALLSSLNDLHNLPAIIEIPHPEDVP